jgi:hypothetical protein
MDWGHKGRRYLRTTLSVALGAGAALGGAFIVSRVTEKQGAETRMSRLEGMLEKVGEGPAEKKKPAPKPKAKPTK